MSKIFGRSSFQMRVYDFYKVKIYINSWVVHLLWCNVKINQLKIKLTINAAMTADLVIWDSDLDSNDSKKIFKNFACQWRLHEWCPDAPNTINFIKLFSLCFQKILKLDKAKTISSKLWFVKLADPNHGYTTEDM